MVKTLIKAGARVNESDKVIIIMTLSRRKRTYKAGREKLMPCSYSMPSTIKIFLS